MIYIDTSVVLAELLGEERSPPLDFWDRVLVASRLVEYEVWNRLHARGLGASHGEAVRALLARVAWLELAPRVLARVREPFPLPVRTLDALHLASIDFLIQQGQEVKLATYDVRLGDAAAELGFPLYAL